MCKKTRLSNWFLISVCYVLLTVAISSSLNANDEYFFSGKAGLEADQLIISFSNGVVGLIFDTSDCEGCKDSLPLWRFIEDLKIDSLVYMDSVIYYNDPVRSGDFQINSNDLIQVFDKTNVSKFIRRAPWEVPGDTLYWDSVRLKWQILYDLSEHYRIEFNDTLSIDSVILWLGNVTELESSGGLPIPFVDEVSCPNPWTPNDFDTL